MPALSVGRGNGKTTLIAAIGAAAVDPDGPLVDTEGGNRDRRQFSIKGKSTFNHIIAFLETRGHDLTDRKAWRIQDSVNKAAIQNLKNKATVKCIGSDPSAGAWYGAGPDYR